MTKLWLVRLGRRGGPGGRRRCRRGGRSRCSHASQGYVGEPGIATDEQAAGWQRVFEAVHAEGGRIVLQIMHADRGIHPDTNGGRRILATARRSPRRASSPTPYRKR
ncbi:hypothetical protein ACFYMI_26040 [Streptomyces collinus]|uniref:oxidoreductase n=1 Tax=Streptomyces collinus TaxID=42684 RepID=UPI00368619CB